MKQATRGADVKRLRYQARRYLTKHAGLAPLVAEPVPDELQVVAVVPCYDEPTVRPLLDSLWEATPPEGAMEVLLLINASAADAARVHQRNRALAGEIAAFDARHGDSQRRAYGIDQPALPSRLAGVGLARKLAMDEALRRLAQSRHGGGLICSLDADCRVDTDYWQAVSGCGSRWAGASIYFEHDGADSPATAIGRYELYMRYYRNALRLLGHPHGFHSVGSAMAVQSAAYAAIGGMNKRRAGEDFYFLKKLLLFGELMDITSTTVRPASRSSTRVPFGTGRALLAQQGSDCLMVPGLRGFRMLAPLFAGIQSQSPVDALLGRLDPLLAEFLLARGIERRLQEISANTASPDTFVRRFYAWFDGLKIRQWLNYWSAHGGDRVSVVDAAGALLAELPLAASAAGADNPAAALRRLDKGGGAPRARFLSQRR